MRENHTIREVAMRKQTFRNEPSVQVSNSNIVASEDPGGNLNLRTNINAQQSARKKAMIWPYCVYFAGH